MEYLVPALAVVVIGAVVFAVSRWMSATRERQAVDRRTPAGRSLDIGPQRAREAASLLDEDAHRRVYGHIAQSRVMEAVRDYRAHTGRSLKDAVMDVQSLAVHPQVYSVPVAEPEVPEAEPGEAGAAPERGEEAGVETQATARADVPREQPVEDDGEEGTGSEAERGTPAEDDGEEGAEPEAEPRPAATAAADELSTLTVPADWTAAPTEEEPPFEVEVMRGMDSVRLSSQDLPPWLRDQLAAMVRDGNLESAAVQLSSHSQLSVPEAYELLRRMRDRRGED